VAVNLLDLIVAVLRLYNRHLLVMSVYVDGTNARALADSTSTLHALIQQQRNRIRTRTVVILVGDFNQHDALWGGDNVVAH
ncbi:hypothetical protein BU23DRAFT_468169, partial [Bimuria novae-zelandiae CBS 107.79]